MRSRDIYTNVCINVPKECYHGINSIKNLEPSKYDVSIDSNTVELHVS